MLVLCRQIGEGVWLHMPDGSRVYVMVTGRKPNGHIKLGFEAPDDVKIYRDDYCNSAGDPLPRKEQA